MSQTQEFRGVARAIYTDDSGARHYVYHRTAVVTVNPDRSITLRNAGYRTRTTMLAMNQASNQDRLGFRVSQRNREWHVTWQGTEIPFTDGMRLSA